MLSSQHLFERWEILHRDFLGLGGASLAFCWDFAALKAETESLCDCCLKEHRAISCGRKKANMTLGFVKKDVETRVRCPALLTPAVVPTHSTC